MTEEPTRPSGRLVCVGIGMMLGSHLTPLSRSHIEQADVVFTALSDGIIELKLNASSAAAYKDLVAAVTKAAAEGAAAENAFRGVKPGDLTAGAPAAVRSSVKPF